MVKQVERPTIHNRDEYRSKEKRPRYPSDMSQNGWKKFKQAMPVVKSASKQGGRPAVAIKEVINAIFYVVKTGCSTFAPITPIRDLPIQGDVSDNNGPNSNQTSGGSSVRKNLTTINPYGQTRRKEQERSKPLPPERAQIRTLTDPCFRKTL